MTDVKHVHQLVLFHDTVHHTIDVRLVAVEQMLEARILRCHRAPFRMLFEAEDNVFEATVPVGLCTGIEPQRPA
jgi:hypothetical protein